MKIVSWNVNGLRAATRKGFKRWFRSSGADVIALQEVRARPEQLDPTIARPRGWRTAFSVAERKGYSGVGLFTPKGGEPDAIETTLGRPEIDREGRLMLASFKDLLIVNGYFPNGNGTTLPGGKRSNDRVPYKLDFYRAVFERLEADRRAGRPILVLGDFNTAPYPIDLARPRSNKSTSGFLPEERAELVRWLDAGWVDTFRHVHGQVEGAYTWWAQRSGCRERNVGWRIDLILASEGAIPFLTDAFIEAQTTGSDHCPIGVVLDPSVTSAR